jgi:hypothetical protein
MLTAPAPDVLVTVPMNVPKELPDKVVVPLSVILPPVGAAKVSHEWGIRARLIHFQSFSALPF